jgi:hypothetical protein
LDAATAAASVTRTISSTSTRSSALPSVTPKSLIVILTLLPVAAAIGQGQRDVKYAASAPPCLR